MYSYGNCRVFFELYEFGLIESDKNPELIFAYLIGRRTCLDRFIAVISKKDWPAGRDQYNDKDGPNTSADDGKWHAKPLGCRAGFDLAQLRTAHEENLVDTGHASPD